MCIQFLKLLSFIIKVVLLCKRNDGNILGKKIAKISEYFLLCFTLSQSFLPATLEGSYCHSNFIDEETEAYRG